MMVLNPADDEPNILVKHAIYRPRLIRSSLGRLHTLSLRRPCYRIENSLQCLYLDEFLALIPSFLASSNPGDHVQSAFQPRRF